MVFCSRSWLLTSSLCMLLLIGCGAPTDRSAADSSSVQPGNLNQTETFAMKVTSTAFDAAAAIPAKYTGVGQDDSPPLAWSNAPEKTKSLALIYLDESIEFGNRYGA